ncbi:MAG: exodeoxyribonuclease III [Hyphomicrobiales bacterium]|nr:MAG: exodeoxyribonuclease III [Hyphomicrobiales bacterium]
MKIATWNINGIKARLAVAPAWLKEAEPDIAVFQEIKSIDENFPREVFEELGYEVHTHGQKGFNGVAILSKVPLEDVERGLPGDPSDEQARFISALAPLGDRMIRIACLYLPNGNPVDTEKFPYKLAWMERLIDWAKEKLETEEDFILAGDYNVIAQPIDCYDPAVWEGDALCRPESRDAFYRLCNLGLTDALRATSDEQVFTFWDYQAGAWPKNNGIRIDHLMMSPGITDSLLECQVDKHVRAWEKPSDHVPIWIKLKS